MGVVASAPAANRAIDAATSVFHGDRVEVKHSNEYVAVNDDRLDAAEDLAADCAAGD